MRYSKFTATGEVMEHIDLPGFIQLYVNHRWESIAPPFALNPSLRLGPCVSSASSVCTPRPVNQVTKPDIEDAFKVLVETVASQRNQLGISAGGTVSLSG